MKGKRQRPREATRSRTPVILYSVAALFAAAGLADATYLTVIALTGEAAACGGSAGCSEVLGSSYARVAGIPVAAFGLLGYFSAFSLAVFAAFNYARAQKLFILAVCALFVATLWFLYVQAFLLHAYCRYCLFSAAISFLLMGLVVAAPGQPKEKP
ncbi:MAG: hypothetical protein QOF24_733 [Verrucomicrobiota bacterium]|jgi:uncharacterized membrane protein